MESRTNIKARLEVPEKYIAVHLAVAMDNYIAI